MVCNLLKRLDSGFRRNDGKENFSTFYEFINFSSLQTLAAILQAEPENSDLAKMAKIPMLK